MLDEAIWSIKLIRFVKKAISVIPEWLFCLKAVEFFLAVFLMLPLPKSLMEVNHENDRIESAEGTRSTGPVGTDNRTCGPQRETHRAPFKLRGLRQGPGQYRDEGIIFSFMWNGRGYLAKRWIVYGPM